MASPGMHATLRPAAAPHFDLLDAPQSVRTLLHLRPPLAWAALGVTAIYTSLAMLWTPAFPLIYAPFVTLAILDWGRFVSMHGLLRWREWWARHPVWVVVAVVMLGGVLFLVLPFAYCIQCLQLAPTLRAELHRRTAAHIAALEASLASGAAGMSDLPTLPSVGPQVPPAL